MRRHAVVLVAHGNGSVRRQVRAALETRGVGLVYARTCRDVRAALDRRRTPDVVLVGTSFAAWRDVVTMARTARPPVDVFLTIDEIRAFPDPEFDSLDLESMDQDAFDFLVVPSGANLAQVLALRFGKPQVIGSTVRPRPTLGFSSSRLSASARGRYSPASILGRNWGRGPTRIESRDRVRPVTKSY